MSHPDSTTSKSKARPSKRTSSSFKLQGNTNFPQWDLALRNTLTGRGLLQYITKPTPPRPIPRTRSSSSSGPQQSATAKNPPSRAEEESLAKWRSDRARCTQIIMNSLSEKVIKTLLDNEPRAFEGCGDIKHTGFDDDSDTPSSSSSEKAADPEVILDGTNPKSLYDFICECYTFTSQEAVRDALGGVEGMLNGFDCVRERSLGEAMARFRFLKRSLNEIGRAKTEFGWRLTLKTLAQHHFNEALDWEIFHAQLIDEILDGHREKRWEGNRVEEEDDDEDDCVNHQKNQHENLGIKSRDENQDESEDEPLKGHKARKGRSSAITVWLYVRTTKMIFSPYPLSEEQMTWEHIDSQSSI